MFNRGYLLSIATILVLLAGTSLLHAQEATQPPPKSEVRTAWRRSMVRIPLPKKGCFTASYPDTTWREVPCSTERPYLLLPQSKGGKGNKGGGTVATVGGSATSDWAAHTTGLFTSTEGTFNSVTSGISESAGPPGGTTGTTANSFSLQLNTNTFSNTLVTSLCRNAAQPSLCQGWEQFVFQNNMPPSYCNSCVSIEYWLFPYGGGTCPSGWSSVVSDCVITTSLIPVTPVTISSLSGMTLVGKIAGGSDTVVLDNNSTLSAVNSDSTLDLADSWTTSEFNVLGGGGGAEAYFTDPGTTVVVKTTVDDGTMNKPTCILQSNTAESNNMNLANLTASSALACCTYGGATPNIQFMETNASPPHTGVCGLTQFDGEPHAMTADGTHYNFQGAGEFIYLRDPDGAEIQTRQKAIPTTYILTDPYDGLTSCVSINTAVAAHVAGHRLTWEPNLSGVPDPGGLQLRIDGTLTTLGPQGMALGAGGRVVPQAGGVLEVDFPDGKTLLATPQWWSGINAWYLNVDVSNLGLVTGDNADSVRGITGPIADGSWLPALPNGSSVGSLPASLPARYETLYKKFADAWRVSNKDSLFDYAPGTSTNTFTNRDWPKENPPCILEGTRPVEPASEEIAQRACRRVSDLNARANCVFDVRVTGNLGFATTYLTTQRVLADSTTTSLTSDSNPSQAGEWVTFTASVVSNSSTTDDRPSGTVQFAVDGANAGAPVTIDSKERATWDTSALKVGAHRITATYVPASNTAFLPSTSLEILHTVKRCACENEHGGK